MSARGYRVETIGTVCIVHVSGTADMFAAEMLQAVIDGAAQRHIGIVLVSFADCTFGDGSWLKILIAASKRLEERLLVVAPRKEMLRRMLHVTSLSSRFALYETLDAAYLALTSDPNCSLGELAAWTARGGAGSARAPRRARLTQDKLEAVS